MDADNNVPKSDSPPLSEATTEAMTAPVVVDTPVLSVADSTRTLVNEVSSPLLTNEQQQQQQQQQQQEEEFELPPPPQMQVVSATSEGSGEDCRQMLSLLPIVSLAPVPVPEAVEESDVSPPPPSGLVINHQVDLRAQGQPDYSSGGTTPSTPSTPEDMMSSPTRLSHSFNKLTFDTSFEDANGVDSPRQSPTLLLPLSAAEARLATPKSEPTKLSIVGTVPSVADLSKMSKQKIPPDCLEHVRGMLQRAKDRADPITFPQSEDRNPSDSGSKLIQMEEQMGRSVLQQNEITLREQIFSGMGQSSPRRSRKRTVEERKARSERKRQKELSRLAELRMLEMRRLQALSNPQQPPHQTTEMERIREEASRSMTKQLQRGFKKSAPPFAGSPTDFLDRGIINSSTEMIGDHNISYNQLAAGIRRAYWVNKIDRNQQAAEEQFKRSQQKPASPLQYLSKLDKTAATSVRRQPDFKTSLERFQFELTHGPSDDIETSHDLLAERRRQWK